jgi:hypothetical protein
VPSISICTHCLRGADVRFDHGSATSECLHGALDLMNVDAKDYIDKRAA